jgi:hypothetical protein
MENCSSYSDRFSFCARRQSTRITGQDANLQAKNSAARHTVYLGAIEVCSEEASRVRNIHISGVRYMVFYCTKADKEWRV